MLIIVVIQKKEEAEVICWNCGLGEMIYQRKNKTRYKTEFSYIFKHNNKLWQKILLQDILYGIHIGEIHISVSDIMHDYGTDKVKRKLRRWKYKILKEYKG